MPGASSRGRGRHNLPCIPGLGLVTFLKSIIKRTYALLSGHLGFCTEKFIIRCLSHMVERKMFILLRGNRTNCESLHRAPPLLTHTDTQTHTHGKARVKNRITALRSGLCPQGPSWPGGSPCDLCLAPRAQRWEQPPGRAGIPPKTTLSAPPGLSALSQPPASRIPGWGHSR